MSKALTSGPLIVPATFPAEGGLLGSDVRIIATLTNPTCKPIAAFMFFAEADNTAALLVLNSSISVSSDLPRAVSSTGPLLVGPNSSKIVSYFPSQTLPTAVNRVVEVIAIGAFETCGGRAAAGALEIDVVAGTVTSGLVSVTFPALHVGFGEFVVCSAKRHTE
jgi:hypothetical protein